MTYPTDDSHFFYFLCVQYARWCTKLLCLGDGCAILSIIWPRDVIGYGSGGREWIFRADRSGEVKVGERVIGFIFETRRSIDSTQSTVRDGRTLCEFRLCEIMYRFVRFLKVIDQML
jgi:hypothetical protein